VSIRRKLMILLLGITLVPLIGIVALNRITLNVIRDQVSSDIGAMLEENAIYTLNDIIEDYDALLKSNIQLMLNITELQAVETEKALAGPAPSNFERQESTFGFDRGLKKIRLSRRNYFYIDKEDNKVPIDVSFRRQNYIIVKGTSNSRLSRDMSRMSTMTSQYYRLFQMQPDIIYWLHTTVGSNLHITYPAGAIIPEGYDPKKRGWYKNAIESDHLQVSPPYIDASTRNPIITISKSIRYPDGAIAGVTGLDFNLSELFQWLRIKPEWSSGAEAMLIAQDKNNISTTLKILARMNYSDQSQGWDKPLKLESLNSSDKEEFAAFEKDIMSGNSGVRILNYKDKKSIWAYRGFAGKQVYPVLIIPFENFTRLVEETESFLWEQNLDLIRYSALFAIIVIIVVITISFRRARAFTRPINELALAGDKLSGGDFDARVEIKSGDELEQLGGVFNQIGPKLREHEKMQNSLEVARAIQQRLLPKEAPHAKNFDLAGLCKYSDETGGDYYDFVSFDEIEPGKISVILGDVTGHGIGAALLMASARSMLRNNIRHYAYDLSRILQEFNNELVQDTDPDKFITLFYGLLDDKKKTISWALGGHDPAIWFQNESGETKELSSAGVPLGFVPDMTFDQEGPADLKSGDIIVVGTDGIWEAENADEEMFGKERMVEVIRKNIEKTSIEICQAVVDAVLEYTTPQPQDDDITILVVKVL